MVVNGVVPILLSLDTLYYYVLRIQFSNHVSNDLHLMSFGFHLVQSHHSSMVSASVPFSLVTNYIGANIITNTNINLGFEILCQNVVIK